MKVYVSKAYLEWIDSKQSEQKAIKAFNRFLKTVYDAKSPAETPKPRKRDGGTAQGGNDGSVISYEIARTYRLYANWRRTLGDNAEVSFFAAIALSKSNEKNQSDDIGKASAMFKYFDQADWVLWEPSSDLLNEQVVSVSSAEVEEDKKPDTTPPSNGKKGKPTKNGLTVAERKAQQKEEEAKRKQAEQNAARERRTAAKLAPETPVVTATPDTASVPVPQAVVADSAAADDVNKSQNGAAAESVTVSGAPDVGSGIKTNGAQAAETSTVTLNGTPVAAPHITGDAPEFHDVLDVAYKLELINRQMELERLQIEIARQKIVINECKIALEKLAIEKLKLLHEQKMSQLQAQK